MNNEDQLMEKLSKIHDKLHAGLDAAWAKVKDRGAREIEEYIETAMDLLEEATASMDVAHQEYYLAMGKD